MPILDSLVQDCNEILYTGTFDDHEVLNEKSVFGVPSCVQNAWGWIEQVTELFVIDLQEWRFNIELLISHGHLLPHVPDRLEEEPVVLIWQPAVLGNRRLLSHHGIGLSRSRLPIGKNGGAVPLKSGINQLIDAALLENLDLSGVFGEHGIEPELLSATFQI